MELPADQRLGLDIKTAEQALMAAKTAALREENLTVAQYAALLGLHGNPGISAAALARQCLVTPQAMTSVLKALEERGLVERAPHPWHHNIRQTRLTASGERLLARADALAVRIERRIIDALSESDRVRLRELLSRVTAAIRAPG